MAHPLTVPALRATTLDPPGAGFAQPRIFEDFDRAPVIFIRDVQRKTYEILL
jgi:hypothetical protein